MANETGTPQGENFVKSVKSRMYSPDQGEIAKIIIDIQGIINSGLLSPKEVTTLQVLLLILTEKEQQVQTALVSKSSHNESIAESESQKEDKAFRENEKREKELELLKAEYLLFKDDFHEQLDKEYALLEKAERGELTTQERNRILGRGLSEVEQKQAKEHEAELSYRWNVFHKMSKDLNASINFRQKEIDKNDKLIKQPNTSEEKRSALTKVNKEHKDKILQHDQDKKHLVYGSAHIERSDKIIIKIAEKDPEVGVNLAERQHREHGEDDSRKLNALIKKLAELKSSGKPLTREQINDILKESTTELATNNQNVKIEAAVQADTMKETFSSTPSSLKAPATPIVPSNKRLQHGNTEVKKGWVK